ncbi:hypothetical protein BEP19_06555 [Ammoniphilus oxalaticus]|uniref:UPF0637 protein BEP19_06555 n=1 Tax=Ammoniphilus oxalaticus TaxID=66863 RepID=A0A419SJA8_9BACL|nr:DUF1054 domain-containing protein [Ammoniphilus oxalaticus]RKD24065.1 hypothetical protein BEP19_06555 [Ammoniphilus oxalaticus]
MSFNGFSTEDFDVFTIDGLPERMEAISSRIRPKFEVFASYYSPFLTAVSGHEMFPHIAKHARRTVNPPNDTWIAFSTNKRGYKMAPHFQIGLWKSHLFVWFALIYEAKMKATFAAKLLENLDQLKNQIPADFVWSWDHMSPEAFSHGALAESDLRKAIQRVKDVKKAEILCGINIDRSDPILADGNKLIEKIETTFETIMPLYELSL